MKLLTKDVIFLNETLQAIASNEEAIKKAPIEIKFILVRNLRATEDICLEFNGVRKEIIENNSEPVGENSDERKLTKEQIDFINGEIKKLEEVEVDVPIVPVPLSKLDSLELDLKQVNGLYPIINEEA